MEPLVSVIIPVFNVEPYLRQCLDSVIGQTYKKIEILIVDDGSTDRCGYICDEYGEKDKRIRVFHTKNRGLSAARNRGVDEATGDYVVFLDSDDWLELNAIGTVINAVAENEIDIVCFQCIKEFQNTKKIFGSAEYVESKAFSGNETIIKEYCIDHYIHGATWDKLYKVDIFDGIRFPDDRYFEDIATTHRFLLRANQVLCIPDVLLHYRARGGGISRGHDFKHIQDQWLSSKERYEEISQISEECGAILLSSCIDAIGRMWCWYSGFTKENKKKSKVLLKSMKRFSRDHFREIIRSKSVSKRNKAICVFTITTNRLIMRMFFLFNRVHRRLRTQDILFE